MQINSIQFNYRIIEYGDFTADDRMVNKPSVKLAIVCKLWRESGIISIHKASAQCALTFCLQVCFYTLNNNVVW